MPSPFHVGAHTASTLAHRSAHYLRLSLGTSDIPLDVTLGEHKGDLQPYVAHPLHTPMAPLPCHCPVAHVCASPWAGSTWVGTAQGGRRTHTPHTTPTPSTQVTGCSPHPCTPPPHTHGTSALPLPCASCVCKPMGRQHMGGHCTRCEAHTHHTHTLTPGDQLAPQLATWCTQPSPTW